MNEEEAIAILQRYSEAWKAHDPDAIAALHTKDTRFTAHGTGPTRVGRDGVRTAAAETFAMLPDFDSAQRAVLFGPEHWVIEWTMINDELRVDCIDLVVLDGGLIKTKDTYFDSAQLQDALAKVSGND
jgi:hypothetical protein